MFHMSVFRPKDRPADYEHFHEMAVLLAHKFPAGDPTTRSLAEIHDFCFMASEPIEITLAKGRLDRKNTV